MFHNVYTPARIAPIRPAVACLVHNCLLLSEDVKPHKGLSAQVTLVGCHPTMASPSLMAEAALSGIEFLCTPLSTFVHRGFHLKIFMLVQCQLIHGNVN